MSMVAAEWIINLEEWKENILPPDFSFGAGVGHFRIRHQYGTYVNGALRR